jgi:hypothetical protein
LAIEQIIECLSGYRRLSIRCERKVNTICDFLNLAATLICCKKLAK